MTEFTAPTNAVEVLEGTITLLTDPAKWGKDWMATDEQGQPVQAFDAEAVCFCILGGLDRAAHGIVPTGKIREYFSNCMTADKAERKALEHVLAVTRKRYNATIPEFNDNIATHDSVLSVLNEALKNAKWEAQNS